MQSSIITQILRYSLFLGIMTTSLLAVWLLAVQSFRIYAARVPTSLPWVGLREKIIFPRLRATLRDFTAKRMPINEGWRKYGRHDQPFVLPSLNGPEVILPPSHTQWLVSQPEHILSVVKVQDHLLALPYLGHGPDSAAVHDFSVIQRDLTRQIGKLSSDILTEIESVGEDKLGSSSEWTDISVTQITVTIAQQVATRIFLGPGLSDNKSFRQLFDKWAFAFGYIGLFLRTCMPASLFPMVARALSIPATYQKRKVARILVPEINQRIKALHEKRPSENLDALQWIIEDAAAASDPRLQDPWNISGKMMLFHLFAEHTTAKTSAIILFDIVTCEKADELLSQLRAEAEEYLPQVRTDPYCTRKMLKLDSVIRESMRLNPMSAHALSREVMPPSGITTPGGLLLPKGCRVAVDVSNMQRVIHDDGDSFDPLRHYHQGCRDGADKQKAASQVDRNFLTFSLGRHACPGRFLAIQTMKLMLSYLIVHYDIEPIAERPEFLEIGEMVLPPTEGIVRFRRRCVNSPQR